MSNVFELVRGVVVTVPEGVITHPAKKPDAEGGETPMVARLRQEGVRQFTFCRFDEDERARSHHEGAANYKIRGKVAFVPRNTKPGTTLVIDWVDERCVRLLPARQGANASMGGIVDAKIW